MKNERAVEQKLFQMEMLHKIMFKYAHKYTFTQCEINLNGKIAAKVINIKIVVHCKNILKCIKNLLETPL